MKKILIIEDDEKIALALCVRLKAYGQATWIAGDRITGFSLAVRHKPDLILLDISLPGGDGLALAEQFNEWPETRQTPIIFATASQDPELRKKVLNLGASGLVRKPYETDELLRVVQHALEGEGRTRPAIFPTSAHPAKGPTRELRKRILIVEDDRQIALGLALRMKAAGFDAAVANDALSGVRSAVQTKPDAVVLDISMPAGDGFTVAERIQANIPTPTPIIFLTASRRPDFRQRARQLGAVGFFEKPYEPEDLLAAVRNAVA